MTKLTTPFTIHAAAYWAARGAYDHHRRQCRPIESADPLQIAYEAAYEPLVTAMHDAAVAAVQAPAETYEEMAAKVEIFGHEDLHQTDRGVVKDLLEHIVADAKRIGGAA